MNFKNLKLWTPTETLTIPPIGIEDGTNKKNICFFYIGDNVSFLDSYNSFNINKKAIRYLYIPTILKPVKAWMDPALRKRILKYGLRPVKGLLGNYSDLEEKNFFFDTSLYFNALDNRYKITRYNTEKIISFYSNFLKSLEGIPSEKYEKTIIYSFNLDKPINESMVLKRFYPLYYMLLQWEKDKANTIPFDKIILFLYNTEGCRFIKIFDIFSNNNNVSRIKSIITRIKTTEKKRDIDGKNILASNMAEEEAKLSDNISTKLSNKIKSAVWNYLKTDNSIKAKDLNSKNINSIARTSVLYHAIGDPVRAKVISKHLDSLPPEKQKEIVNKFATHILPKDPSVSVARDSIVKMSRPEQLIDYQWPQHIFKKRKIDFNENLKKDIFDAFSTLNKKNIPLKVKSIDVKKVETGPSEIYKTIKDRYIIKLEDQNKKEQEVYVDFPRIDEWGAFDLNGAKWILVNQLVRFPIFFPSINVGRFESSFSTMKIISKELQKGAYFLAFLGSYKLPLIMLLGYMKSFSHVMKDYGITYKIEEVPQKEKTSK